MSTRQPDSPEQPVSEADPRFKSGLYRGHYVQRGCRSAQELTLWFAGGVIAGMGADPVGVFGVRGSYDLESGRVRMVKHYPGAHSVHYDASAELQHGIWGLWVIHGSYGDRGGFQIWPVGAAGQGEAKDAHADRPVEQEVPIDWAEPVGV